MTIVIDCPTSFMGIPFVRVLTDQIGFYSYHIFYHIFFLDLDRSGY